MIINSIQEVPESDFPKHGLTNEKLLWMLRRMLEIRLFEEKVEELFLVKGLLVGPSHLYLGQEAIAVGVMGAIEQDDPIVTTYRCHGHAIAKGVPVRMVMAELFGKATGTCKGLGGSMHAAIHPEKGSLYATAIVGSGVPIAAGMALAQKYLKDRRVVVAFFGDGAINTGAFNEAANIISLWRLPILMVCENNLYGEFTRIDRVMAGESIAHRVSSYGIDSVVVEGNDIAAVYLAASQAAGRARQGLGPTLLECRTYRQKGHGVYDKAEYRPREEVEEWLVRDPVKLFREKLIRAGIIEENEFEQVKAEVKAEVEEAEEFAIRSSLLPFEELESYVYAGEGEA